VNSPPSKVAAGAPFFRALGRFFGSVDLRSLALLRVVLGGLLIADLLARFGYVDDLYSNDGVLTNHFSLFRPLARHQFSLYVALSSPRDVAVAFALTLVVYLLFTLGYRTRLFQVLSFICVTSLHSRNLLAELPSDIPLHLWMAWSLVLPLGARFSLDSLRKSLAREQESSPEELNRRESLSQSFTSIAVFGMLLQLAVMHVAAALRQSGDTWRDGTAFYYALRQNLWVTDWGAWIARHASLASLQKLALAYRVSEIVIGLLVLVPVSFVRRVSILLLLLFHLASRAVWNFGLYDWVMVAALPILVSPRDWEILKGWYQRRKAPLTVYFDEDCGICLWIARLLKRLDALARLTFVANTSDAAPPEVKAVAADTAIVRNEASGKTYAKARAMAAILRSLPLCAPLGLALSTPGLSQLADRLYDSVARRRTAISVWFGLEACGVRQESPPAEASAPEESPWDSVARALALLREGAAAAFLGVCVIAFMRDMNDATRPRGFEATVYSIIAYPRLFQTWGLFAPDPPKRQGTLVVEGWTARGTKLDPFTGQSPLESLDPSAGAAMNPRPRPLIAAYFSNISQPARATYIDGLRDYIQKLGDKRDPNDKLVSFTVNWVDAPIPPPEGTGLPSDTMEGMGRRRLTARP